MSSQRYDQQWLLAAGFQSSLWVCASLGVTVASLARGFCVVDAKLSVSFFIIGLHTYTHYRIYLSCTAVSVDFVLHH